MDMDKFWESALSASGRRVIWVTRRSPQEHAGFLDWVSRLGDEAYDVVDLTDAEMLFRTSGHERGWRINGLSHLGYREIVRTDLWEAARPFPPAARESCRQHWRKLRAENAEFRIVQDRELVSVPMSFVDELLLSSANKRWQKVAKVVGVTMEKLGKDENLPLADIALVGRVRKLAERGLLEGAGDLRKPRYSEVRLAAASN